MHLTSVTATDETPIKLKLERFEVPPPQKESGTQRYPARDALTRNGRIMMCGGAVFMYCLEKRTTGSRGTVDSIKLIAKKKIDAVKRCGGSEGYTQVIFYYIVVPVASYL